MLALDVSGSVDPLEYDLQRQGLARALTSPAVRDVLLRTPDAPVWIAVFEWSGPAHQVPLQEWTAINADNIDAIANRISTLARIPAPPTTALGSAMQTGTRMLTQRPECWQHTLDISGDGIANTGRRPQDITLPVQNITINGLIIDDPTAQSSGSAPSQLAAYYAAYVIRGRDAFVEVANGFDDYADAMERKLLRELNTIALSQLN